MLYYLLVLHVLVHTSLASIPEENEKALWDSGQNGVKYPYKSPLTCPQHTRCLPISSCPFLNEVLNNECARSERLANLACGYQGSGYVCCPQMVQQSPSNQAPTPMVDGQECGIPAVLGRGYKSIGAYPFVARIGFKSTENGDIKYPCSGSIINNRVILTAAHCALAKSNTYKLYSVRIGEWLLNSDIDCGPEFCGLPTQDIPVSHVIVHPGFNEQIYKDDIALIVLSSKLNYSVTAQPLCLPEKWPMLGGTAVLVGWGKKAGENEMSNLQQVVHLPLVNYDTCSEVYSSVIPVTDSNICAGGEEGKDACSGFGGAPLLEQRGDIFYQIGIMSFGSDKCGMAGVPSVYVNVRKYIEWIYKNLPTLYN
ncbi:venom protease [Agrilus planipennis]|uniref:Venom protease n=1 Tax=Agrilus planipennis TaxID=224129 RepID=A0A1W4X8T0_AGRPL|nr:venom protease [Agrilus planipennis]